MPYLALIVLIAPFLLAWLSGRRDRPGLATALVITGIGGLLAAAALAYGFSHCFTLFEPEPKECEAIGKQVAAAFIAWGVLAFVMVVVACWSFWGSKAGLGLLGVGVLVAAGAWGWTAVHWPWEPDYVHAEGAIGFTVCPNDGPGDCTRYVTEADGSDKPISIGPGHREIYRAWGGGADSPDGSMTAVVEENERPFKDGAGLYSLWLIDADGERTQVLENIYHATPLWSPDSHFLVVYRSSGFELAVVDTRTLKSWRVAGGTSEGVEPTWSPDSRHIAYGTYASSTYRQCNDLHVVQRDGSHDRRLTRFEDCSIRSLEWLEGVPSPSPATPALATATATATSTPFRTTPTGTAVPAATTTPPGATPTRASTPVTAAPATPTPTASPTATSIPTPTPTPTKIAISMEVRVHSPEAVADEDGFSHYILEIVNRSSVPVDVRQLGVSPWYSTDTVPGGPDDCVAGQAAPAGYLPQELRTLPPGGSASFPFYANIAPNPAGSPWAQCLDRQSGFVVVELDVQLNATHYLPGSWWASYPVARGP
ncbi:MAG: TolB family protein [Dehalococcoidia bacterium]